MSTSFVHRGGRGFWCPDWLLEVLAAHAGAALRGHPDVAHVGEAWAGLARARILGCLDLGPYGPAKSLVVASDKQVTWPAFADAATRLQALRA